MTQGSDVDLFEDNVAGITQDVGLQQNLVDPVDLTTLREEDDVVGSDQLVDNAADSTAGDRQERTLQMRDDQDSGIPGN